jgi:enamine deaminase RidA (YjgF/YER057c/UK114 family)
MASEIISGGSIPAARGHYSAGVIGRGTRVLEISGCLAENAAGDLVGAGDAGEQARQCLRNIDAILREAGATREDIIRIGIYVTDMADRPAIARAREEYFGAHKPAATLVQIVGLVSADFVVEIEATAVF